MKYIEVDQRTKKLYSVNGHQRYSNIRIEFLTGRLINLFNFFQPGTRS